MAEPLPTLRLRRTRREAAEFVFSEYERYGLPITGGSRFHAIKQLYERTSGTITPEHPQYEVALEAERDIQSLAFVFDNCAAFCASSEFFRLLKATIGDSKLPQLDRASSSGRDNQFHLYVAAICCKAGLEPRLAEPDIICRFEGQDWGVAAKRVKNAKRLKERVYGAADQIERARIPGIVAAEISLSINKDNLRPQVVGQEDYFATGYLREMQRYAEANFDTFCSWLKGTQVRGIMLHDSYVTDARHGDSSFLAFNFGIGTVRYNARREKEFIAFKHRYDQGLHNRQKSP